MSAARWTAQQLELAADGRRAMPLKNPRYNPCPAGVIRDGSATAAVLTAMRARPGLWLTHGQLLNLTNKSTKAVCWACLYLQAQGLIESTTDDSRNARYRRYRVAKGF